MYMYINLYICMCIVCTYNTMLYVFVHVHVLIHVHVSVHVHDMCIMLQCMLIIGFFCYLVVSEEYMIISDY